ncbi:nickel transport system ATP-binding protein [Agrobacterium vitis]|nr:nickel transport system ATP-binding protein [Agrobacterium vitis]MBE1440470.1 nickel transport system ATP-binding protein [Agrobacterium vitis]
MTLLQAKHLSKHYQHYSLLGANPARTVVDDVSLAIAQRETVALLGRSGCGKSTLARLLAGLEPPDKGEVLFNGTALKHLKKAEKTLFRRSVQMVFQDSPSAVNPRFDIGAIISEPLRHLGNLDEAGCKSRTREVLDMVELPAAIASQLPGQVSGGQLQRVCIARALACAPKLIILDEAVSNLDLHLQASALSLLQSLQDKTGIAYLFVTHDLRLVERFASRVLIMDAGRIVEETETGALSHLSHPASLLLKSAILPAYPRRAEWRIFSGL